VTTDVPKAAQLPVEIEQLKLELEKMRIKLEE